MITEMIHTASLVHDDVIDGSDERRGKQTINELWGERKVRPPFLLMAGFPCVYFCETYLFSIFQAILAGDFILSAASMALARIGNITVVKVLSQVIEDLVRGKVQRSYRSCQFTQSSNVTGRKSSSTPCPCRWIHAAGLQREWERAIQTLPRENIQEDGESYCKQL